MIKKLVAAGDYADIEVDFREVDLIGAEDVYAVLTEITDGNVVRASKNARVQARPAVLGEVVDTRPRCVVDGKVYFLEETQQTIAQKHIDKESVVVANPDGETYVVAGDKFVKKYEATGDGSYMAIEGPKKFVTVTENICFKAPWGEMIYSPAGSKLCIEYLDSRDIYSVTNSAFESTYQETEMDDADEND